MVACGLPWKAGDRVQSLFFQNWHDGPPNPDAGPALGAYPADGMLSEYVALPERGLTHMAQSLSFVEAATLPDGVRVRAIMLTDDVPGIVEDLPRLLP